MRTCDTRRIPRVLIVACVLAAFARQAHAQGGNQAAARALFDEGRRLMQAGQHTAACPKFEAANALHTSAGILLNLGDCHEKTGRTASAWTEFGEAASVAKRTDRAGEADEALRRQQALKDALSYLLVRVPRAVPGLVVQRDGSALTPAAWGERLPVDPGKHELRAKAPGYEPWTTSVVVSQPRQVVTVDVPPLRASPVATAATRVPAAKAPALTVTGEARSPTDAAPPSRLLGGTLIGGGAAVGLGGAILMMVASSRAESSRTNNDPAAYDEAKGPWTIGLVGAITGGLAVAGGILVLTIDHGHDEAQALRAVPWAGSGLAGLSLGGTW